MISAQNLMLPHLERLRTLRHHRRANFWVLMQQLGPHKQILKMLVAYSFETFPVLGLRDRTDQS